MIQFAQVERYCKQLQQQICETLGGIDGNTFKRDSWESQLGQGVSCMLEGGAVIERGGVGVSIVEADALPPSASAKRPELAGAPFKACGVSVVIHPLNPYVPTSHMNVRFFCAEPKGQAPVWWFGGGFDLTPYYPFLEDCQRWHQTAFDLCKQYGDDVYPKYKQWCDDYFYLKHRGEARGIGGIFFDDLSEWGFESCFEFMQAVGSGYIDAYSNICKRRYLLPYGSRERAFQLYRRGRYVEFNLVYDRGTLFGLQSGGRTESILMSMPPKVSWCYDWKPKEGSAEDLLSREYLQSRDWILEKTTA